MAGRYPDHPVRVPLGRMGWEPTVFLHYPCTAEGMSRLLPAGLEPQLLDGQAWLSVTPLTRRQVRPAGFPAVPGWSTFPELNVRTYVKGPGDNDGLWFFRLDCPRRLMVWGLNLLGLHYRYREAEFSVEPEEVSYLVRGQPEHALRVRVGEPVREQNELDIFLTGRWNAFALRFNRLIRTPIAHQPWLLYTATVTGSMLTAPQDLGFPVLTDHPISRYSPGVDVRVGFPRSADW
jgi:uncharacterized protein